VACGQLAGAAAWVSTPLDFDAAGGMALSSLARISQRGRCIGAPDPFERVPPTARLRETDHHGGSFEKMIVPEAANMPPTPWQTEILASGTCAGAMPRI
jgi:hypothetical protein